MWGFFIPCSLFIVLLFPVPFYLFYVQFSFVFWKRIRALSHSSVHFRINPTIWTWHQVTSSPFAFNDENKYISLFSDRASKSWVIKPGWLGTQGAPCAKNLQITSWKMSGGSLTRTWPDQQKYNDKDKEKTSYHSMEHVWQKSNLNCLLTMTNWNLLICTSSSYTVSSFQLHLYLLVPWTNELVQILQKNKFNITPLQRTLPFLNPSPKKAKICPDYSVSQLESANFAQQGMW